MEPQRLVFEGSAKRQGVCLCPDTAISCSHRRVWTLHRGLSASWRGKPTFSQANTSVTAGSWVSPSFLKRECCWEVARHLLSFYSLNGIFPSSAPIGCIFTAGPTITRYAFWTPPAWPIWCGDCPRGGRKAKAVSPGSDVQFYRQHSLQVFAWSIALTCTLYRFRGYYWYSLAPSGHMLVALLTGFSLLIPVQLHKMYRERRSPKMLPALESVALARN